MFHSPIVLSLCLSAFVVTLFLLGCAKSKESYIPLEPARELYSQSQSELEKGEYVKAYHDYQKALAIDPGIGNLSYLYSILYDWAISQSEPEDIPLLKAQKQLLLKPDQLALREELLSLAVDKEKGIIYAFGVVIKDNNNLSPAQQRLLVPKAALSDAQVWVARVAKWIESGVKCPFDISMTVTGVEKLKGNWIDDTIYIVKIKAPIDCLG